MIETDEQRRWWFATHPEYSRSRRGTKTGRRKAEEKEPEKVRPEEVDAYVDNALQYVSGPVAELLKSVKRNFGTEGYPQNLDQRLAYVAEPRSGSEGESTGNGKGGKREATFWDAVLMGIHNTLRDWERLFGLAGALTRPSRTLARNLRRAGRPRPADHDAHHIVPASDNRFPEAKDARKILEKFKIDSNDASNGVWLPNKPGTGSGAYHRAIHGGEYYKRVLALLSKAKTRGDAIRILKQIGRQLSNNTFLQ